MNITVDLTDDDYSFYANARKFHTIYEIVIGTASYLTNFLVAYLGVTTKNTTMKQFSTVILMNVFGDLLFNTMNVVVMPIVDVRFGLMYFVNTGLFENVPNPYAIILISLWLSGVYVTIINVLMQFLYRYNIMCMKRKLSNYEFLAIYCVAIIYSFTHGFAAMVCFDQMNDDYTKVLQTHPMYHFNTLSYTAGDTHKIGSLVHFGASQIVITVGYVIIYITGKRINKKLTGDVTVMSKRTLDAQKKLTKVMILQAIYPGIIVGLPILVVTIYVQAKLDLPLVGLYCVTSLSLIPLINAVTVICIITSFRKRVQNFLKAVFCMGGKISDINNSSTQQKTNTGARPTVVSTVIASDHTSNDDHLMV